MVKKKNKKLDKLLRDIEQDEQDLYGEVFGEINIPQELLDQYQRQDFVFPTVEEMSVFAHILAELIYLINPTINKEATADIMFKVIADSGLGMDNVTQVAELIRKTSSSGQITTKRQ